MRKRLREAPSEAEMTRLYPQPHQHTRWVDHRIRVDVTTAIAGRLLPQGGVVVDLSCGDAAIADRLVRSHGGRAILGDYAFGHRHTGPIERTVGEIAEGEADLWILSETLEHLADPELVLRAIRPRTRHLILSTPAWEVDDSNPEHVWSWSPEDVEQMLQETGFKPLIYNLLDLRPAGFLYAFLILACE